MSCSYPEQTSLGVFVNYLQPPHDWQAYMLDSALRFCDKVVLVIKGCEKSGTSLDPLTFETRAYIIKRLLWDNLNLKGNNKCDIDKKLTIVGLPDITLSWKDWWTMLYYNITRITGNPEFTLVDPQYETKARERFPNRLRKYIRFFKPKGRVEYVLPDSQDIIKRFEDLNNATSGDFSVKSDQIKELMAGYKFNDDTLKMIAESMSNMRDANDILHEHTANVGVFISRFQPVHRGHLKIVRQALEENDKVLIIISSSDKAGTLDNPLSISSRRELLTMVLEENLATDDLSRIEIMELPDMPEKLNYDSINHWSYYLMYNIIGKIKQPEFTYYYGDPDKETEYLLLMKGVKDRMKLKGVPRKGKLGELDSKQIVTDICNDKISVHTLARYTALEAVIKAKPLLKRIISEIKVAVN